jgi:hypothetical protein
MIPLQSTQLAQTPDHRRWAQSVSATMKDAWTRPRTNSGSNVTDRVGVNTKSATA